MKKKNFLIGLLFPLLAGCALMPAPYVDPAEYDLEVKKNPLPDVRFEAGTFRNLSGSDRRFLYREEGNRMISDDYNRWLLSPDLLLARQLEQTLSPDETGRKERDGTFVRIGGAIYRFDFDRETRKAVLSVDYKIRIFSDQKPVGSESATVTTEAAICGSTPEAAAAAMSVCVEHSIARVRTLLLQIKTGNNISDSERK